MVNLMQVEDLCAFLFPEPNIDTSSSRVPLAVFPPEVLHVITEFLILPTIHDVMRCSVKLREMLTADAFWQHFYIKLFPPDVRNQVEEFEDIDGCSVRSSCNCQLALLQRVSCSSPSSWLLCVWSKAEIQQVCSFRHACR